ncbi:hypothetical protein QEZ54_01095 [Catellatospora sp. KI3]|uniref:hypothetical protein n=1 Tax=Catellatospora sp. KI3 TaxID=3041620 RepID=UPI002482AF16|nr:hypothetical protein [Catellatospora sp. KI3]MDI1459552.1 hypothetical protein [Catellatospora sp. KI3]
MKLDISAGRLLRTLLCCIAALHALSLGFCLVYHGLGVYAPFPYFGRLVKFFYVDKEDNLPTWYSSGVLLLAALLLWQVASRAKASGARFARHWRILSFVFALLSIDEYAQIHEIGATVAVVHLGQASYLSWLVLAAPFVLVLAVSYTRFLLALPGRVRLFVLVGAALFLSGAAGMEVVGAFSGRENIGFTPGWASMRYVLSASFEELLEMTGATLFVYAIAHHLQQHQRPGSAAAPAQAARETAPAVPAGTGR